MLVSNSPTLCLIESENSVLYSHLENNEMQNNKNTNINCEKRTIFVGFFAKNY